MNNFISRLLKRTIYAAIVLSAVVMLTGPTRAGEIYREYRPTLVNGRVWVMEPYGTVNGEPYRNSTGGRLRVYRVDGDTIVGDVSAKIVRVIREWNRDENTRFADTGGQVYVAREENGVVYALFDEAWLPILDFTDVSDRDSVNIRGEQHYRVKNFDPMRRAIEGIGALTSYPFMQYNAGGVPTMWIGDLLAEVHEGEESVVEYRELADCSDATFNLMVRPDRIWVYGGRDPDTGKFYKSKWRFGAPVVKGVRTWRPFVEFERYEWEPGGVPTPVSGSFPEVLLREYRNTVFMMNPDWKDAETLGFNPMSEIMLYHFATNQFSNPEYNEMPDLVTYDAQRGFTVNPEPYTASSCQWTDWREDEKGRSSYSYGVYGNHEPVVIEGVGITSLGYLPFISAPGSIAPEYAPRLLEYCDADGNVLEKFGDMPEGHGEDASVKGLTGVSTPAPSWYTLQGMRVSEPKHGQLLIRVSGGKAEKIRY